MALVAVVAGNIIHTTDLNQYRDLLTGTTTDQPVTLKNVLTLTHGAVSGAPQQLLVVTGAADTGLTSELIDAQFNLARTVTIAPGSLPFATQRAVLIQAPTYTSTGGGGNVTDAATLAITDAPTISAPLTATNKWALLVSAGAVKMGSTLSVVSNITSTTGIIISAVDGTGGGFKSGASSDVQWYRGAGPVWHSNVAVTLDGKLLLTGAADADVLITAKAFSGTATGDLLRLQTSAGANLAKVDINGAIYSVQSGSTGGFFAGAAADVQLFRTTDSSGAPIWRANAKVRSNNEVQAGGDTGSGDAGFVGITNSSAAPAGTNTFMGVANLSRDGTNRTIQKWLKVWVGATAYYVPLSD